MSSIKWHSIKKEGYPKEDGKYLVTVKGFVGTRYLDVMKFSNALSSIDEYDFPIDEYKNKKGFYTYNSEYGYTEWTDVIAWIKTEEYEGE